MKRKFRSIPRPVRACLWAALVLAELVLIYIALGCPALSMRQELRRAERAHLVGPSKIVDVLTEDVSRPTIKVMVGETEHGISFLLQQFYNGNRINKMQLDYYYREKTGDLTVAALPVISLNSELANKDVLTVYLFDDYPQAQKASIRVHMEGDYTYNASGTPTTKKIYETFSQSVQREKDGFFRFRLVCSSDNQGAALEWLSRNTSGADFKQTNCTILATVKLYDANGNLILEREMDFSFN